VQINLGLSSMAGRGLPQVGLGKGTGREGIFVLKFQVEIKFV